MSIYYVTVGKTEYQVEINGNIYKINGEVVQASLIALKEHGVHLFKKGLSKREIHVKLRGKSQYIINIKGVHAVLNVGKFRAPHNPSSTIQNGDIIAPLPGQIISVHVTVGEHVEEGQIVVVMELMKMQMIMHAACSGQVTEIKAEPGLIIAKGEILVNIEEN